MQIEEFSNCRAVRTYHAFRKIADEQTVFIMKGGRLQKSYDEMAERKKAEKKIVWDE
jgi:hypothetical protein